MRAKGLFLFFFLLLHLAVSAQHEVMPRVHLTWDSLDYAFTKPWYYHPSAAKGDSAFGVNGWTTAVTYWSPRGHEKRQPKNGWWRLPFSIDSTLVGKALALQVTQRGASEIYLDGALIRQLGRMSPDGKFEKHFIANSIPIIISFSRSGDHELLVRMADRDEINNITGFSLSLAEANQAVSLDRSLTIALTGLSLFFVGLFLAFSILHGVLFVYYRAASSNLWFALFSLCLAVMFGFISAGVVHVQSLISIIEKCGVYIILAACFTLSGFINSVFFKNRYLGRILFLLAVIPVWLFPQIAFHICAGAIISVSFEVFFTIVFAIIKRRPGARIIGAGLLLLTLMIIVLFMKGMLTGNSNLTFEGNAGITFIITFLVAVLCLPVSMSAYLAWRFASVNKALSKELVEVERLSANALEHEAEKQRMLESRSEELEREVTTRTEELRRQKQKSDDLLLNILPAEVAEELKERGKAAARQYDDVSVLFTDFVDFTQHAEHLTPDALVEEIDSCFRSFDEIIGRYGLEKIKTVGDAYIAVSGMPASNPNHAVDAVRAGLEIKAFMEERLEMLPGSFGIRLGIHSGPVVAGIVGVKKFAYDIWGDTVNTAARMEQYSDVGELNISEATYSLIKDRFVTRHRGALDVKHKGSMHMYFVDKEKVAVMSDGIVP